LLERLLVDFAGTVLLVSHDRAFLDNVVTSILAFEGRGHIAEYVGGYEDWQRQRPEPLPRPTVAASDPQARSIHRVRSRPRKLSYNETRELAQLPEMIQVFENEQAQLYEILADPSTYRSDGPAIATARKRLAEVEAALAKAYGRWEQLDAIDRGADIAAS